jgi:hypothetical protein
MPSRGFARAAKNKRATVTLYQFRDLSPAWPSILQPWIAAGDGSEAAQEDGRSEGGGGNEMSDAGHKSKLGYGEG